MSDRTSHTPCTTPSEKSKKSKKSDILSSTHHEQAPTPYTPEQNLAVLRLECHLLIDRVCTRPGAMKLMIAVHRQLQMFAAYKANRRSHPRPP